MENIQIRPARPSDAEKLALMCEALLPKSSAEEHVMAHGIAFARILMIQLTGSDLHGSRFLLHKQVVLDFGVKIEPLGLLMH